MALDRSKPLHRRSRSLKNLLQLPLLSRLGDSSVNLIPNAPLPGVLPADIFLEIITWLWKDDVLTLSLTVSGTSYPDPFIYPSIVYRHA